MKTTITFLSAVFSMLLLYSCANGKNLQAQIFKESPYYVVDPGQEPRDLSDIKLFVPIKKLPQQEVQLDSVYFRGRKAALLPSGKEDIFVAEFQNSGRSDSFVMSSNPKEEYGNQVPVLPEKITYDLAEDEAVIIFSKNGKKGHYKLDGVRERNLKIEE